jgi:hypothetical protein
MCYLFIYLFYFIYVVMEPAKGQVS